MLTFDAIHHKIENAIKEISFSNPPKSLYDPIVYTLALGGKRVRPALTLMANNLYCDNIENAIDCALGIEMFHNFTLLHDDLMDDAEKRRNKPTVHKLWNPNTAILSGDAMMIAAYELIAKTDSKHIKEALSLFTTTALEICGGQQFDMEFENRDDVKEEEYLEMIRLKTAVLLGCSLKMGAILGDAPDKDKEHLYKAGIEIGMAFQLQDDLLDVYGDTKTFGKNIGGDILCNKKTFLLINALRRSSEDQKKILDSWISKKEFNPKEKINAITEIYTDLNLKEISEHKIEDYFNKGVYHLNELSIDPARLVVLKEMMNNLLNREV